MNLFMNDGTDPRREQRVRFQKTEGANWWISKTRRVYGVEPFQFNHASKGILHNTEAQHYLAVCYYYGVEVAQNYFEAAKLYRQAAEQNSTESQYDLSQCYAKGVGVPQDLVEATAWLFVSIHGLEHDNDILTPRPDYGMWQGNQSRIRERKLMLDDLCNQLTDWQMQAAQNRARVILANLEDNWKRFWASPEGVKHRAELDRPDKSDGTLRRW